MTSGTTAQFKLGLIIETKIGLTPKMSLINSE